MNAPTSVYSDLNIFMRLCDIVKNVVIDARKLTDYALNPESPLWRHKARVFESMLGFTLENYTYMLAQIEEKALTGAATFHSSDEFGLRYTVNLLIRGTQGQHAIVRTGWFIPRGADEAKLVTLYVRR